MKKNYNQMLLLLTRGAMSMRHGAAMELLIRAIVTIFQAGGGGGLLYKNDGGARRKF